MTDQTLSADAIEAIRTANDALRTRGQGGRTILTLGIAALPPTELAAALRAVATFSAFTPDNDPYGEHDCATIDVAGTRVLWKIDYYDQGQTGGSDRPDDLARTSRVLTIMLAEQY